LAKTRLVPLLEETFSRFPAALIDTHGKDLTVSAEPSRAGTPNQAASAPKVAAASSSSASVQPKVEEKKGINTTTVQTSADFMAPADDLFKLLTDEKRIPSWTRAPAQVRRATFIDINNCKNV
jgi:activator of HSP90 ATPase